jgi:ribosomal protein L34/ribonuclease P protein component
MSITYNPKKKKRGTTHGFLVRMASKGGRKVLLDADLLDERSSPSNFPMIPKESRIKASEFKGIKARLTYRGALFDVSTAPSEKVKFAVIISKKRIKRAVDRNRAKRKIYALFRQRTPENASLIFIYPTKTMLQSPPHGAC